LWDRPDSCCYCVFHALGEYQASALLLQERTNSDFYCVLSAVVQYQPSEYFFGIAHTNVGYCFYMLLGSSRLTSCFCGTARIRVASHRLHALGQCQNSESLLWGRPNPCLLLCFTYIEAVSGQRLASAGSSECMFLLRFVRIAGISS